MADASTFDQMRPLGPDDYAQMAGLTPQQAAGLPLAVLESLATRRSYAEGDIQPIQQNFGEPLHDPAGTKEINDWLELLAAAQDQRQSYGTSLARGGRVQTYPPLGALRGFKKRRRAKSGRAGALAVLSAKRHV